MDSENEWHFEPNQAISTAFDDNAGTAVGTANAVRGGKLFVKLPKIGGVNQAPDTAGYKFYSKTVGTALAFNLWADRTKNTAVHHFTLLRVVNHVHTKKGTDPNGPPQMTPPSGRVYIIL